MRIERKVTVGDREVTVRELTIGEIRQWIAEAEVSVAPSEDMAAALALLDDPEDQQALIGIERLSDFPIAELVSVSPSALRGLLLACREVNADFFGMLARAARVTVRPDPG